MTKNIQTVSQRITSGVTLLLLFTLAIGGAAAWQMKTAAGGARELAAAIVPQAGLAARLSKESDGAQLAARTYGLTGESASLKDAQAHLAAVQAALDEARQLARAQPSLTVLAGAVESAETALTAYVAALTTTAENQTTLAQTRAELDAAAAAFLQFIGAYITSQDQALATEIGDGRPAAELDERRRKLALANDIIDRGNTIRIANYKSQALRDPAFVTEALKGFAALHAGEQQLLALTRRAEDRAPLQEMARAVTVYETGLQTTIALLTEAGRLQAERTRAAEAFGEVISGLLTRSLQRTDGFAQTSASRLDRSTTLVSLGGVIAVVAGLAVGFLLVRGLNRALRATAGTLTEGAVQIAAASGQVSSASQALAAGASEQAASLEEISSSIVELSSTTQHNSANAAAAKIAADQARATAEHGASEMIKMQQAMDGIRQSSHDISKIIKTIDEVAFQTNILALNAAVEAARAGEAGAGFAVVADEVRNLAQRCSIAARETTEKISDATSRSELGATLTVSVNQSLQDIVTKTREVDRLVAEVANASREQSEGITQVSSAVSQMDKVTQSNAASAEETASAAEELNAQSVELRHSANGLGALVGIAGTGADVTVKPEKLFRPELPRRSIDRPAAAPSLDANFR